MPSFECLVLDLLVAFNLYDSTYINATALVMQRFLTLAHKVIDFSS